MADELDNEAIPESEESAIREDEVLSDSRNWAEVADLIEDA